MTKRRSPENENWGQILPPVCCPLCGRKIPDSQRDEHHLIPRLKGGKIKVALHRVCHRQIHALLTESEIAKHYSTIEALLSHPELQKFVKWVRTKSDDFADNPKLSKRLR